jgi:hypothetical protein
MLGEMDFNKGGRPSETSDIVSPVLLPRLTDLGISNKQSSRWQRMASVPEDVFEQYVNEVVEADRELTIARLSLSTQDTFTLAVKPLNDPIPCHYAGVSVIKSINLGINGKAEESVPILSRDRGTYVKPDITCRI